MKTSPLHPNFGLVVRGFDPVRQTAESARELARLLHEHKVLLLKGVAMTEVQYIRFASLLGEPVRFVDPEYQHPDYPEIFVVSNVKKDGKKFGMDRVGYCWHSDSSFMPGPLPVTMLHARIVPPAGGQTAFIDMNYVYEHLPEPTRAALDPLRATHESKWRYLITAADVGLSVEEILERDEREVPSQVHPLVVTHPVTGRRALYASQGITRRVLGVEEAGSTELLDGLWQAVLSSPARYEHQWELGDFLMWDNRSVVHRAFPAAAGGPRQMFRIGISDGPFFGRQ
jgi:taurine dioxygenase